MSNHIEIEITPIEEATEAILEAVKEHFLKGLDEQFISPTIEAKIGDYIAELKDGLFCVIEYPYVDKVFRDSYYNYYSSKHYSYQRDCIRVSLFRSEIKPEDFLLPNKHQELNQKYLGFFILRPTISSLFGRSVINPEAFEENGFKICSCKNTSFLHGVKLETFGFPHSSQDSETIKCAETTIWALMEYFGTKYNEYRPTLPSKIHKALEGITFQRQLPSNGLTMDQISFALKEFGFGTRVYSFKPYEEDFYTIIDSYVESGIPTIIGLESESFGHVIIAIGKLYESNFDWEKIKKNELAAWGEKVTYYDSTNLPAKYVVQDDNLVPYRVVTLDEPGEHYEDEESQSYKIDSAVIPLYPKIYLESFVAKKLALQVLKDETIGYKLGHEFVFRFFLASSRSFKNHLATNAEMENELKNSLLLAKMPKFIWCAEFYTQKSYELPEKEAIALVVLDATEANMETVDALIFAGYPDHCVLMNENNFVYLQHKFINYRYFSNLK